jgi:hypothetical protein
MKRTFYLKCMLLLLAVQPFATYAQKGFFQAPANARLGFTEQKHIRKLSLYQIREADLRNYLIAAPLEFRSNADKPLALEIPLPNGTLETFHLYESPILAPHVAARHPEIKTYSGKGYIHREFSIRLSFTADGFNAIILGVDGDAVYYEKVGKVKTDNLYMTYFTRDAESPKNHKTKSENNKCGTGEPRFKVTPQRKSGASERSQGVLASSGATLRTFRLAMAANAEFTTFVGGGTSNAFNVMVGYVNRMNAVFRKELSVQLELVTDQTLVFDNTTTDGYTNSNQTTMLDENQAKMDGVGGIGTANYDIGHVLGYAGSSGGGIASSPSVCDEGFKAQGVSGVGDGSYASIFDDQLIQHEIGHQFGMSHSYNSNIPVCTTRSRLTSVEPGSGTTIMSYGYTCDTDDYETPYEPILNFHTVSYNQAQDYISTLTCFSTSATGNTEPVISVMPGNRIIPKQTPFILTGTASDADATDVLNYSWEGTNIGDVATPDATTLTDASKPPFFRSYPPASTATRTYPRLGAILNGDFAAPGDKLPSVGVVTTHRLTVRDNDSGVTHEEVTVTMDENSGPFLITNNFNSGPYFWNSSQTVTWDVANSNIAPVSCANVDILYSTDGGLNFIPLVSNTPNDGSEVISLPPTGTTQARIKVAAVDNIFFDISNVDFTIMDPLPITLRSFNVKLKGTSTAELLWETTSESNNQGFEIEMGTNPREFTKVGYVEGKGTSTVSNRYSYSLSDLAGGTYYFRLKQLDYDGKFEHSMIRAVMVANDKEVIAVYPNPVKSKIKLNLLGHHNRSFSLKVVNQAGQTVIAFPYKSYSENHEFDTSALGNGLFYITVQGKDFTESLRFAKF